MADVKEKIESLMVTLGERGKFQIGIHLLLSFTYLIIMFNHVIMAFHGAPMNYECNPNNMNESNQIVVNSLSGETPDSTYSSSGANQTHQGVELISTGKCSVLLHDTQTGDNMSVSCKPGEWKYLPKYEENNIISEFDLVCSRKSLASTATTIYFAGVMLGGLMFGDLADRFGRRPVLLVCMNACVLVGLVTAFSVNYTMFVVSRFVNGILIQGLQTSAYTMLIELYRPKYRPFAGAVAEVFFGSGVIILSGLAYFLQDWRHLQIVISLAGALGLVYFCVVPESLRWLLIKGKLDKAEIVIQKICRTNKLPYPDDTLCQMRQAADKESSLASGSVRGGYNLTYLFRTPRLRRRTLVLLFVWLVISTCYYGVTFKMAGFKVNRYLIYFVGGVIETIVYAVSIPIMNRFGRKKPLFAAFMVAGVMCIASGLVNDFTTDLHQLSACFALVGRCALALLFGVIFVYTSELYPTVIRNIGMGFACFWARVGGVLAPQMNQWGREVLGFDVILVFGLLSLAAGGVVLLLAETHNTRLPDSIAAVEEEEGTTAGPRGVDVDLEDMDGGGGQGEPCLKKHDPHQDTNTAIS